MQILNGWEQELAKSHAGRAWLGNMAFDAESDAVSDGFLSKVRMQLEERWRRSGDDPFGLIETLVLESNKDPANRLHHRGPASSEAREMARLVEASVFFNSNVDTASLGMPRDEWTSRRAFEMWDEVLAQGLHFGKLAGYWGPYLWATPAEDLLQCEGSCRKDEAVDKCCNALGRAGTGRESYFFLVTFSIELAQRLTPRIPTTLDAGSWFTFQAVLRDDRTGFSYDLLKKGPGLREVVLDETAVTADGLSIRRFGRTTKGTAEVHPEELPSFDYFNKHCEPGPP